MNSSPTQARRVPGLALAGWLLICLAAAAAESPSPAPAEPAPELDTVFETRRLPDLDLLVFWDGRQETGTLLNDPLRLRLPEGEVSIPLDRVAGLELSDGRGALDVLVTVNRDRLSGFLLDKALRIRPEAEGEPVERLAQEVRRVILRRRPQETRGLPRGSRVVLRRGDFFTGTLRNDRFRVVGSDREVRWGTGEFNSLAFPPGPGQPAQLRLAKGEALRVAPVESELEFDLDVGPRLRVYPGWIEEILTRGPLPEALARRIGVLGSGPPMAAQASAPPPGVRPIPGLVWIPPGDFVMGSPDDERDRDLDEGPQTPMVIPSGFWIGQHEVTQAEFKTLTGTNPSLHVEDPSCPVERVNWQEAMDYCERLTHREQAAGHLPEGYVYRLPTEAEWEYACRAGTSTRFSFGDDGTGTLVGRFAWFDQNSSSAPHPVGSKEPNRWGLHDTHGNVLEWCLDAWSGVLPGGRATNAVVRGTGTLRVARGGSWLYAAPFCRSANRDSYSPLNRCSDLGFRIVLAPK